MRFFALRSADDLGVCELESRRGAAAPSQSVRPLNSAAAAIAFLCAPSRHYHSRDRSPPDAGCHAAPESSPRPPPNARGVPRSAGRCLRKLPPRRQSVSTYGARSGMQGTTTRQWACLCPEIACSATLARNCWRPVHLPCHANPQLAELAERNVRDLSGSSLRFFF